MYKICEFGYMLIAHVLYCTRHHSQINTTFQLFPSLLPPPFEGRMTSHGGGGGDERTTRPAEWLFINCSGQKQEQKEQIWIKGLEWNLSLHCLEFQKVWGMMSHFFWFSLIFSSTYIHSITFIQYIHPSPLAKVPLHLLNAGQLSVKNLPIEPSRESNLGLAYSRPTHYQLSHVAP